MRVMLLALILANAGLFLWQRYDGGYQGVSEAMALPAVRGNIVLLSESDSIGDVGRGDVATSSVPVSSETSGLTAVAVPSERVAVECWLLGPYAKAEAAALPAGVTWRLEEYERNADYWVFLGPYDDVPAASAMSRELKAKRIDSYVIRRGELNKAVSLGVFSDEARAKSHRNHMRNRGYSANIRKIAKVAQRLWLVLELPVGTASYAAGLEYLRGREGEERSLEKKSCNRIASYKDFD